MVFGRSYKEAASHEQCILGFTWPACRIIRTMRNLNGFGFQTQGSNKKVGGYC